MRAIVVTLLPLVGVIVGQEVARARAARRDGRLAMVVFRAGTVRNLSPPTAAEVARDPRP